MASRRDLQLPGLLALERLRGVLKGRSRASFRQLRVLAEDLQIVWHRSRRIRAGTRRSVACSEPRFSTENARIRKNQRLWHGSISVARSKVVPSPQTQHARTPSEMRFWLSRQNVPGGRRPCCVAAAARERRLASHHRRIGEEAFKRRNQPASMRWNGDLRPLWDLPRRPDSSQRPRERSSCRCATVTA